MAPPGTVSAASSPLPRRTRAPGAGSRPRNSANSSNSPIDRLSQTACASAVSGPISMVGGSGATATTPPSARRCRGKFRDQAPPQQESASRVADRGRRPRLRLPRPHRRRPVVGDPEQGRALRRLLALPGADPPRPLLRPLRLRLGPDPAQPRLPDRRRARPGRLGPAAAGALRAGEHPLRPRAGPALGAGRGAAPHLARLDRLRTGDLGDLGDRRRRLLHHQAPRPPERPGALGGAAADPAGDPRPLARRSSGGSPARRCARSAATRCRW